MDDVLESSVPEAVTPPAPRNRSVGWVLILLGMCIVSAATFWVLRPSPVEEAARAPSVQNTTVDVDEAVAGEPTIADAPSASRADTNADPEQELPQEAESQQDAVAPPPAADAPPSAEATSAPFVGLFPIRVEVPSAEIRAKVVETGLDAENRIYAPDWDAGHYVYSSKPGEVGNVVIVGHVYQGKVFHTLSQAQVGDTISVFDEQEREFRYTVDEVVLVPVEGASAEQIDAGNQYIQPTPDARLTLVTCWPEVGFTHRLIVIARPTL